jgi:5-methyltetrahydrofolate--homocysteine methyltransferase
MSELFSKLSTAVIEGNLNEIVELTEDALDDGLGAKDILDKGLMVGMDYVGVEFKAGNMFVPEVLRSARAMQSAMTLIKPLLAELGASMTGKIILGTVKGDLHDIGKNLVHVSPTDDHHAFHGAHSQVSGRSWRTRQGQDHNWRRPCHPGLF